MRSCVDQGCRTVADLHIGSDRGDGPGGLLLFVVQFPFPSDAVEIVEQPKAQLRVVPHIKQQLVQFVGRRWRMFVELKVGVPERIRAVILLVGSCRCRLCPRREESHHRVSVMPRGRVVQKLSRLFADCAEQDRPGEQFGVAHLI